MKNLGKFYIDGKWVAPESDRKFPVLNPATEEQIGEIILGNEADVNKAVAAAKKAFESYSRTTSTERMKLLERLMEVSRARFEDLAQAISSEMGAPIDVSREVSVVR